MKLENLLGKHELSGVDRGSTQFESLGFYQDADIMRFKLDGIVYEAVEDPEDGYRSMMKYLAVSGDEKLENEFPPCEVVGTFKENDMEVNETIKLIDTTTGETVLEVGTDHVDDWYPIFIANFNPKAMKINQ